MTAVVVVVVVVVVVEVRIVVAGEGVGVTMMMIMITSLVSCRRDARVGLRGSRFEALLHSEEQNAITL